MKLFRLYSLVLLGGSVFGSLALRAAPAPEIVATPPLAPATPRVTPAGEVLLPGNNSVTAALVQNNAAFDRKMKQAGNSQGEPSTFDFYLEQYNHFNSSPYLFIIGLPLGQVLAKPLFQTLQWTAVLLFLILAIGSRLQPGAAGRQDLDFFANLLLRLAGIAFILCAPNLIYAAGMTVMNSGTSFITSLRDISQKTPDGVISRMETVLSHAGTFDLELTQTRARAIRNGLGDRQGIFTKFTSEKLKVPSADYWACFFNQLAPAQQETYSNGRRYDPIPRAGEASVEEILSKVIAQYNALSLDGAEVDSQITRTVSFSLDWKYGNNAVRRTSFTVDPLADAVEYTTKAVLEQLRRTDSTTEGLKNREELLQQYEKTVRAATGNWVDRQYIDGFARSLVGLSGFKNILNDIGSWTKRAALGTARKLRLSNLLDTFNWFMNSGVHILQYTLVPFLAFGTSFCLRVIMELNILGLMLLSPFWLLEGTAKIFRGAVGTLATCIVTLPCYQFFQLVLDLLFGALSNLITTGTLFVAATSPGLFSVSVATVMLGLTFGYFVAVVILVFKAPKMVSSLLAGGSWAAATLGIAMQSMVTSAMASVVAVSAGVTAVGGPTMLAGKGLASGMLGTTMGVAAPAMGSGVASSGRGLAALYPLAETAFFAGHVVNAGGDPWKGGISYLAARKEKAGAAAG